MVCVDKGKLGHSLPEETKHTGKEALHMDSHAPSQRKVFRGPGPSPTLAPVNSGQALTFLLEERNEELGHSSTQGLAGETRDHVVTEAPNP